MIGRHDDTLSAYTPLLQSGRFACMVRAQVRLDRNDKDHLFVRIACIGFRNSMK